MDDLRDVEPPASVSAIYEESRRRGFDMVSEPLTGCLLRTLAASKPAGSFLELGTGTGAATAWILDGMDARSRLVTVESDERLLAVARDHLGKDERVEFIAGDGNQFLRERAGQAFDLVFADSWPGKYEGLEAALALVAKGGFYVIDDMDPQPTWPPGHEAKVSELLDLLGRAPGFRVTKLSWASGIVIATRIA